MRQFTITMAFVASTPLLVGGAVPTFAADAPTLSQRMCMPGLQQLATAEKARDASRHDAEITALQSAIEAYDDCVSTSAANDWSTTTTFLKGERVHAHLLLADAFYQAGNLRDADSQTNEVMFGLLEYCHLAAKPLKGQNWFDASTYVEMLAPRFNDEKAAANVTATCGVN